MNIDAIPVELRTEPRWVVWRLEQRDGRPTKVPVRADGAGRASTTDPSSWGTFEAVVAASEAADGIGFVLGDGWVGVDLDGVIDNITGRIRPDYVVADIGGWLCALASYVEVSPSGSGLHVLGRGVLPEGFRHRRGPKENGIEAYGGARFFTVSGEVFGGFGTVREIAYLTEFLEAAGLRKPEPSPIADFTASKPVDLDDQQLLDRALLAHNSDGFRDLWEGRWEGRYGSQSEADLALARRLSFWCGRDPERVDRMFRASGLMRDKWLRDDYRERTIETAIEGTTEVFSKDPRDRLRPSESVESVGGALGGTERDGTTDSALRSR